MVKDLIKLVVTGLLLGTAHSGVVHANGELISNNHANNDTNTLPFFNFDESAVSTTNVTVLEGDVLTTSIASTNQSANNFTNNSNSLSTRGIGIKTGVSVWKDGIVPFYIDPALQPFVVKGIKKAVNTWNHMAVVTLIEIDPTDANSPVDYVHFTPANGCASWIGRQGGAQSIWVAPSCSAGSMMHEIGHALGLEHEHTRPDRDQHISINWDNIDPDKVDNFNVSGDNKRNYGPYDYASIMHYGEYFFSSTGEQTIKKLNNTSASLNRTSANTKASIATGSNNSDVGATDADIVIGQRVKPSEGDIAAIANLYASDVTLVSKVVDLSGQTEVTLMVTNESAQGANDLTIKMNTGDAQLLSNTSDWQCATNNDVLECSTMRLQAATQSKLVLILDQSLSVADLNARLVTHSTDQSQQDNTNAPLLASANAPTNAAPLAAPLADQQLQASAGSTGFLILSALMMIFLARSRL